MNPSFPPPTLSRIFSAGLMLFLSVLCGCKADRGPQRVLVTGEISYQGKPVALGKIRFVPESGSNAPVTTADIVDGRYRADLRGGVPVGVHKVEIEAYNKPSGPPDPLWIPRNYLPRCYGAESKLKITIESGNKQIARDFNLTD